MQIKTNNAQTIMSITEFAGLNQDPDGETAIKTGEFSEMRNFRITDGKHLQIRPGCKKIMDFGGTLTIYRYSGMPPLDGEKKFIKGGTFSWYVDLPGIGRLYANTGGGIIGVTRYSTSYNPSTGQTTVETVTAEAQILTNGGVFSEGLIFFTGSVSGELGELALSTEATQETVSPMLTEMASLSNDAALTPVIGESRQSSVRLAVRGRWHGWLNGAERTVVAYGKSIYDLDFVSGAATKIGDLDLSSEPITFFAFDNKLYQTGNGDFRAWDGDVTTQFSNFRPYAPIVSVSTTPAGKGQQLEAKNILTKRFRVWFSPDGSSTDFAYPVDEAARNITVKIDGERATGYNLIYGPPMIHVVFSTAPPAGSNTVEVEISFSNSTADSIGGAVGHMKYAELFNGSTDTRVFLYGDGSNRAYYSGIPYDTGRPSAEYFPALNELAVGDASTPITSLVRHYSRMLAFKPGSAWVVSYGTIDLADGSSTAAFYVQPVNRQIGNLAPGQVHLLENDPLTLDGSDVYQWKSAGYSAYITSNENNAKRISDRVARTLREYDLSTVRTENLMTPHEYWFLLGDGKALILNYASDAWYYYDSLPFNWVFEDGTETYGLGDDGKLYHFSRLYRNDEGNEIDAYAATGAMDFDRDWLLKYSPLLFVALQPEGGARVTVTTESDRKSLYPEKLVSAGLSTFLHADFAHWAFGTNRRPKTKRVKIKVKKATYYRIIYKSRSVTATATILQTDVKLRYAGNVK